MATRYRPFVKLAQLVRNFRRQRLVSVIDIAGNISLSGASASGLSGAIDEAFSQKYLAAVALRIESTGGTPHQAEMIYRRIRRLAKMRNVPVFAFAGDAATSAGYWVALSADEIYAGETSLIGSISVVSSQFGFEKLLDWLHISRRIYASGENKIINDIFSPECPAGVTRLRVLQQDIHASFCETVMTRRGDKIASDQSEIFSGAVYSGRQALALGLIDGTGDMMGILTARLGSAPHLHFCSVQNGRSTSPLAALLAGFLKFLPAQENGRAF